MSLKSLISFLLHWISINTNFDVSKFDFPVNIVEDAVIQKMANLSLFESTEKKINNSNGFIVCN